MDLIPHGADIDGDAFMITEETKRKQFKESDQKNPKN